MSEPRSGAHGRWLWVAVLLACLVSLVANAWLLSELQGAFAKLQLTRIFPLGDADAAAPKPADASGKPVLEMWGDSRAALWDVDALAPRWSLRRFAIGGLTSSQLRLQLAATPPRRSAVAVVQIGINDLHPLGTLPAYRSRVLAQLRDNLAAVKTALLLRADVVVLTTIFPPGAVPLTRRPGWDASIPHEIDRLNDEIRAAADGKRVLVLDAHAELRTAAGELAPDYVDGDFFLHLNREGYARLNGALSRLLETVSLPRS